MGICFALLLLAEHKDIQERARNEIDDMLNSCNGKIGINELQQLPYLERCIKESLRLYPSVPFISRHINDDLPLREYFFKFHILIENFNCLLFCRKNHRPKRSNVSPLHIRSSQGSKFLAKPRSF